MLAFLGSDFLRKSERRFECLGSFPRIEDVNIQQGKGNQNRKSIDTQGDMGKKTTTKLNRDWLEAQGSGTLVMKMERNPAEFLFERWSPDVQPMCLVKNALYHHYSPELVSETFRELNPAFT